MLSKNFDFKTCESRIYASWLQQQIFKCDLANTGSTFCIMMPPPNITGTLHVGHVLNYTLQDIIIRYKRMRGFNVLWQPGVDHAGIATQAVVERQLAAENTNRQAIGRDKFLKRVWQWKEKSGGHIVQQQHRLGLSPDWSRQCFTMDDKLSAGVQAAFIKMYEKGLIYRDKRLVNWDPKLLTAISDIEVNSVETPGNYWYFRYPLQNDPQQFITIATSRPETLFGDTAVAVNPNDERYQHLIGQMLVLPLVGRAIPIIADDYSDPDKGTGAVKITPAHDFNDFQVGKRHNLEFINILTPDARMNDNVPEGYRDMDRLAARQQVVADMAAAGLLEKVEETVLMLPYGDRSHVVIEPYLTDQWFMKTDQLAARALQAVADGQTQILPESARSVYNHWLENIQPWCLSRQLWWGHRIPAWYTPGGDIIVAESLEAARQQAYSKFGLDHHIELKQDEDVLDTWFSSGLWPFTTLGWPDSTRELDRYYPTSLLITGVDILFFWVARMMMLGLELMDQVPFKTVYLHALVRDEKGQKLSKSKGDQAHIMDPLNLIDEYGADALRFTLAGMASPGRDIRFSPQLVEGTRNFTTKIWNAARFLEHYKCHYDGELCFDDLKHTVNRWIVSELATASCQVEDALDHYHFDRAASILYQFIWGRFCDWYLELTKPLLSNDDLAIRQETQNTVAYVMRIICDLLHPFMPFMTDEIRQFLRITVDNRQDQSHHQDSAYGVNSVWPNIHHMQDTAAERQITWIINVITMIRGLRHEYNINPTAILKLSFGDGQADYRHFIQINGAALERLARIKIDLSEDQATVKPGSSTKGIIQIIVGDATLLIDLGNVVDLKSENQRLQNILTAAHKEIDQMQAKFNNTDFMAKAPNDVIEKNKIRLHEAQLQAQKTQAALTRIKNF